jgi:predicted XRE-type DNA-binding protein
MTTPERNEADEITRDSGNVSIDLGYPDAEERQTKLRLAHALNQIIARRRLTQAAAAERLESTSPRSPRSPTTSSRASRSNGC